MSAGVPYWLPVSEHAVTYPGGQYRVLGLNPNNAEVGLNRDDAERACIDAGATGLAAPVTEGAIRALTEVIRYSVEQEKIRRDAQTANAACEEGAPYAIHTDYEPRCKLFCFMSTQLFANSSTVKDVITNVKSTEDCATLCVSDPNCKCAFYTLKNLDNSESETCWLKGVACDSEELQRYDDSNDAYTHDNIQPCSLNSTVNTCCVHKLQRRYWTAGLRTGFDESDCRGALRNNGVYPYFSESTETGNPREAITRFNNCGSDKIRNWAWVTNRKIGTNNELTGGDTIHWRNVGGYLLSDHWEPVSLVPNGKEQPTGWQGYYTIEGPDPGKYQNCTAAKVYVRGDHSGVDEGSNDIFDDAYSVPWWHDVPCDELLDRWVCDFADSTSSSGVNVAAVAAGVSAAALVLVVAAVVIVFYCRRKHRQSHGMPKAAGDGSSKSLARLESQASEHPRQIRLQFSRAWSRAMSRSRNTSRNDRTGGHRDTHLSMMASDGQRTTFVQPLVACRTDATQLQTILDVDDSGEGHGTTSTLTTAPFGTARRSGSHDDGAPREPDLLPTASIKDPARREIGASASGDRKPLDYKEMKKRIHGILDSYDADDRFYKQYRMRLDMGRREGGQGVVAFAVDAEAHVFAIKFFAARAHYIAEVGMYRNEALRAVLPEVHEAEDNDSMSIVSPGGLAVPPFIVMDRGCPFDTWCRRAEPDFATALQVLLHIAGKLRDMHAAGWAHRDVKDSNVIWNERVNSWELIDFATAAPIGKAARLTFTLMFVAPEVLHAVSQKQTSMDVSGAVDVWALGMMAWAMLTGESPWAELILASGFEGGLGRKMADQLLGKTEFPWERPQLPERIRRRLGILRPAVLAMLRRDPALRPSMQQLIDHWDAIFQHADTKDSRASFCILDAPSDAGNSAAGNNDVPSVSSIPAYNTADGVIDQNTPRTLQQSTTASRPASKDSAV